ncbi:MAG: AI-2E family transporter [Tenericutes bacterium]|nr:AI-2E family transporter [Mycoplasmatota bacterium]
MFPNKLNYKIINLTFLLGLLYIAVTNIGVWWGVFLKMVSVMAPFIIGFVFAYAFTPFINLLRRKGISKNLAVTITVLGSVLLVGGIIAIVLPLFYDQLSLLIKMVKEVIDNVGTKFNLNLGSFEIKITDYLNDALKDIGGVISSTTIDVLSKSIGFAGKFIVGFVGFIYFLADMGKIRYWFKELLLSIDKKAYEYFKCLDVEISNYLKGLGIFMLIQLFEYGFLFFIIGHPNWLILGVLACLTTIIPYFGGLITNILAIIMASVVSVPLVIATIVICLIFPQVDGYFISPKVYGKTNDINPLITIMVVSVGGTLAGMGGIVVALPCYLFVRTTYKFFEKDLEKGLDKVKEAI